MINGLTDRCKERINEFAYKDVRLTFENKGIIATITGDSLVGDSFVLSRQCTSSSFLELGDVTASELSFSVFIDEANAESNNTFKDIQLDGAKITCSIGVILSISEPTDYVDTDVYETVEEWEWFNIGTFKADSVTINNGVVSISALDKIMELDVPCNINFPITLQNIVKNVCASVGLSNTATQTLPTLPNANYSVSQFDTTGYTNRDLLSWACQLMGVNAYVNENSKIELKWFTPTENSAITFTQDMIVDSVIREQINAITGVKIIDVDSNEYISGTNASMMVIEANLLAQNSYQTLCDNLYNKIGGFSYTPFSLTVTSIPYLTPMDKVVINTDNGDITTYITSISLPLNNNGTYVGVGESETEGSYKKSSAFTAKQQVVIQSMKNKSEKLTAYQDASIGFTTAMSNALGLYDCSIDNSDGSRTYIFCNRPTEAESTYKVVANAGGSAVYSRSNPTDSWGTVASAIDKNGNALFRYLTAEKISADVIESGSIKGRNKDITVDNVFDIDLNNSKISVLAKSEGRKTSGGKVTASGTIINKDRIQIGECWYDDGGTVFKAGFKMDTGFTIMDDYEGILTEGTRALFIGDVFGRSFGNAMPVFIPLLRSTTLNAEYELTVGDQNLQNGMLWIYGTLWTTRDLNVSGTAKLGDLNVGTWKNLSDNTTGTENVSGVAKYKVVDDIVFIKGVLTFTKSSGTAKITLANDDIKPTSARHWFAMINQGKEGTGTNAGSGNKICRCIVNTDGSISVEFVNLISNGSACTGEYQVDLTFSYAR